MSGRQLALAALPWLLPLATALCLYTAEVWVERGYPSTILAKGSIAPYTVRAQSDAVLDLHKTYKAEAAEAKQSYVPIYDKDSTLFSEVRSKITGAALAMPIQSWGWSSTLSESDSDAAVGPIRDLGAGLGGAGLDEDDLQSGPGLSRGGGQPDWGGSGNPLADAGLGLENGPGALSGSASAAAEQRRELAALLAGYFDLLEPLYADGVVWDTEFPQEKRKVRIFSPTGAVTRPVSELHRFSETRATLEKGARRYFFKTDATVRKQVMEFLLGRLPANVTYARENEEYIPDISQVTGLKVVLIRRGTVLVRKGHVVDTRAYYALRASAAAAQRTSWTARNAGRYGLLGGFLLMFVLAARAVCPSNFASARALSTVHLAIGALILVGKLLLVHWPVYAVVLPQAALALISAVVFGRTAAVLVAVATATSMAFAFHFDLTGIVVGTAGGATAALLVRRRRVLSVLAASVLVGGAQTLASAACTLASGLPQSSDTTWIAAQAFAGGVLSGPFALLILPFVQRAVGQAPRGKLRVLGDFDHPLVRRLRERAPEVFAHTVRVVNLADRAAKALQADRLLTRVGAMLHDIGKVERPDNGSSPSSQTLAEAQRAHVQAGQRLAQRHGVPEEVRNLIAEHHGSTRIRRHDAAVGEESLLHVGAPRFAGPRPQSIESAIILTANYVEHATTVGAGKHTVAEIVKLVLVDLFVQDQFVACGITQEQLRTMEQALVAYLEDHSRIS